MAILLSLRGAVARRKADPRQLLGRVEEWARDHQSRLLIAVRRGEDPARGPTLTLRLHPAAEGVECWVEERAGRPARLAVQAATDSVGPGYHQHLCRLLRHLGAALRLRWSAEASRDDAGYFQSEDEKALDAAFDRHLAAAAADRLSRLRAGEEGLSLGLPAGERFPCPDAVATPLGPRDAAWLAGAAADPAAHRDVFPWWTRGRGAAYAVGRATVLLWCEARWRPPVCDADRASNAEISLLLAEAVAADPTTPIPWGAWRALLAATGDEAAALPQLVARAEQAPAQALGYRLGLVEVALPGGWWIRLPGGLSQSWEDEGTLVAWDAEHTLLLSVLTGGAGAAPLLDEAEGPDAEPFPLERPGLVGRAVGEPVEEELPAEDEASPGERRAYWRLTGRCVSGGSLLVCTFCVGEGADRAVAIDAWASLRRG